MDRGIHLRACGRVGGWVDGRAGGHRYPPVGGWVGGPWRPPAPHAMSRPQIPVREPQSQQHADPGNPNPARVTHLKDLSQDPPLVPGHVPHLLPLQVAVGGGSGGGGRQLCCDLGLQARGSAWGTEHAAVAEGRESGEGGLRAAAFAGEGHHDEKTQMRKAGFWNTGRRTNA